jgi:hypothetical protein
MTTYSLMLKASTAELASVVWRLEKGRKRWHDSMVILLASLAAGVAAAGLADLYGEGLRVAASFGLIGGVAAQVVWILAQRRRSRKYLTGLALSALHQSPTPVTLGPDGITFAARHFAWSDFRAAQRVDGMTLLAASDFDGLVIRDQDLAPGLTPEQLQTLLTEWKSP